MKARYTLPIFLLLLIAISVSADVIIYDNLARDESQYWLTGYGLRSDTGIGPYSPYVSCWQADDFVLQPGEETITGIRWWGYYDGINHPTPSPTSESFTVRIASESGGDPDFDSFFDVFFEIEIPGDVVGNGLLGDLSGTNAGLQVVREYYAEIEPLTLEAGETYWIAIIANTPRDDESDYTTLQPDWTWAHQHSYNGPQL